jgi:hypothetical protein
VDHHPIASLSDRSHRIACVPSPHYGGIDGSNVITPWAAELCEPSGAGRTRSSRTRSWPKASTPSSRWWTPKARIIPTVQGDVSEQKR